jgi:biopolymer transport protein TolR
MALSTHDAFSAGRRRHRRNRSRRGTLSEINVTPLVDVMLVLLIIFMISAPLLTAGVPLELPRTQAGALQDQQGPITLSIRRDGKIFIGEDPIAETELISHLNGRMGSNRAVPLYVRADGRVPYEVVARVMGLLSSEGLSKINLVTDTDRPPVQSRGAGLDE